MEFSWLQTSLKHQDRAFELNIKTKSGEKGKKRGGRKETEATSQEAETKEQLELRRKPENTVTSQYLPDLPEVPVSCSLRCYLPLIVV